jgi:hypothetical protein
MAEEVYMDIPAVEQMADAFGTFGDVLKTVAQGLEKAIMVLKASAFVGLIGGMALERYLSLIKPRVENMSKKMHELRSDIKGAIMHYQTGDDTGSRRFR